MTSQQSKALDVRDDLVQENKELYDKMEKLTEELAKLKTQHEENSNLIRSIERKYGPQEADEKPLPGSLVVKAMVAAHVAKDVEEAVSRQYGAQRSKIRTACPTVGEFSLEDVVKGCPEVPRAKVANALWNMARTGELRVVRREGEGVRAKPFYEVTKDFQLAA